MDSLFIYSSFFKKKILIDFVFETETECPLLISFQYLKQWYEALHKALLGSWQEKKQGVRGLIM